MNEKQARDAMNSQATVHAARPDAYLKMRGVIIEVDGDEAAIRDETSNVRYFYLDEIWTA